MARARGAFFERVARGDVAHVASVVALVCLVLPERIRFLLRPGDTLIALLWLPGWAIALTFVLAVWPKASGGASEDRSIPKSFGWFVAVLTAMAPMLVAARLRLLWFQGRTVASSEWFDSIVPIATFDQTALTAVGLLLACTYVQLVRVEGPCSRRAFVLRAVGLVAFLAATRYVPEPARFRWFFPRDPFGPDPATILAFAWFWPSAAGHAAPRRVFTHLTAASTLLALLALTSTIEVASANRYVGCFAFDRRFPLIQLDLARLARVAAVGDVLYVGAGALAIVALVLATRSEAIRSRAAGVPLAVVPASVLASLLAASLVVRVVPPDHHPDHDGDLDARSRAERVGTVAAFRGWNDVPALLAFEHSGAVDSESYSLVEPLVDLVHHDAIDPARLARERARWTARHARERRPEPWPAEYHVVSRSERPIAPALAALRADQPEAETTVALWTRAPYRMALPGFDPWPPTGTARVSHDVSLLPTRALEARLPADPESPAFSRCLDAVATYDERGARIHRISPSLWWIEGNVRFDALVRALAASSPRMVRLALPADRDAIANRCVRP